LRFKKDTIKNYKNSDLDIYIERCNHYSLIDDTKIVGHFYCGLDISIGFINDSCLILKRLKSNLTKRQYELQNFNNNAVVGQLTISNFVAFKSLRVTLDIIHKDTYKWQVVKSERGGSIFSNFSNFCGRLFNDNEELQIKWNYKSSQTFKHRLEELPVEGEIEITNPKNHFLIFAGLFLSEMELQMKSVD
jgi:hypothetical protein